MNFKHILLLTSVFILVGCIGSGTSTPTPTVASQELLDPNAAVDNQFGSRTTILANGNIVVVSPNDDSGASNAGAVHLYNPYTKTLIRSIYGDNVGDHLGARVTALANNNFVIASELDDVGGVTDAGSVMLINGATGVQIGTTLSGDSGSDQLGSSSVTALANNNFVIASALDDVGGVSFAGSVMLVNGATGVQIGTTLSGDSANDFFGSSGVTALANNNFVIASFLDDGGGVSNAGSVMLVNGATGVQIATLSGDSGSDQLGISSVTALANNNFVIASLFDDAPGVVNAGSVMLVNGATGVQIGTTLSGDSASDQLGASSVTALANNNFVIASRFDDVGGLSNAGSIRQIDTTGSQVSIKVGAVTNDMQSSSVSTTAVANFYIISLPKFDKDTLSDSGSVSVVAF